MLSKSDFFYRDDHLIVCWGGTLGGGHVASDTKMMDGRNRLSTFCVVRMQNNGILQYTTSNEHEGLMTINAN